MRPRNHRPTPPTVLTPEASVLLSLRRISRRLSLSYFAFSLFLFPSLFHSPYLSFSLSPALSPSSRHPSPCLQQPYKPWSSAGASSFTRAMYLDVSEGRNFASVCVNRSSLSLSLPFSLSLLLAVCLPYSSPPSPAVSYSPRSSLSSSFTRLCSCKASGVCTRATCTSRRVQVCAGPRVHKRVHPHRQPRGVRARGKIRSIGMSDGYVSERYLE